MQKKKKRRTKPLPKKIPVYILDETIAKLPSSILALRFELTRGTYESIESKDDKPLCIIVENENTRKLFKREKKETPLIANR
jgi:hypothetical protein